MPEHSLEDLKTASMPALRHAELVNLGKGESPNKAFELALARWPRRQAKAVRSLAILRRDYGNEAFTAFLMEHARLQSSEHAQGATVMESFDHVFPGGLTGAVFSGNHSANLSLWRADPSGGQNHHHAFVLDIRAAYGLDDDSMDKLVRAVIPNLFEQWKHTPHEVSPSLCSSAIIALVAYGKNIPPGDPSEITDLIVKLRLLAVKSVGRSTRPQDLIEAFFGEKWAEHSLQDVIDWLERMAPSNEVMEAWAAMLQTRYEHNFISEVDAPFWRDLTIGGMAVAYIAQPVIQKWTLRELKTALTDGFRSYDHPDVAMEVLKALLGNADRKWRKSGDFCSEVEELLVACLALGQASQAAYFLNRFGGLVGFHEGNAAGYRDRKVEGHLERMARAAVGEAERRSNYGIASALAEYVGDHETADRLRAVARAHDQKVSVNWTFYVG